MVGGGCWSNSSISAWRARAHLLPVLDRGADVGQDPLDRVAQLVEQRAIVLAPDLDVDDRFADHVFGAVASCSSTSMRWPSASRRTCITGWITRSIP